MDFGSLLRPLVDLYQWIFSDWHYFVGTCILLFFVGGLRK